MRQMGESGVNPKSPRDSALTFMTNHSMISITSDRPGMGAAGGRPNSGYSHCENRTDSNPLTSTIADRSTINVLDALLLRCFIEGLG